MGTLERLYSEYDATKDISPPEMRNKIAGSDGLDIANAVSKRCGYNSEKIRKWIMMQRLSCLEEEAYKKESN